MRKHKPHWYLFYIGECPVCGRDKSYKVRKYTDKPRDRKDRYKYLDDFECYDFCEGF